MIMQGSHMSLEQIAADLLGVFLVWLPSALQMKCSEEIIFFSSMLYAASKIPIFCSSSHHYF